MPEEKETNSETATRTKPEKHLWDRKINNCLQLNHHNYTDSLKIPNDHCIKFHPQVLRDKKLKHYAQTWNLTSLARSDERI